MADVQLADLGAVIKQAYESQPNTNAFTNDEKTKLSGIEAGAEKNPDAAEIKSLYESNLDTNAFTDAEKAKLAGIEAGAEKNPTAEEIVLAYDSEVPAATEQEAEAGTEEGIRRWSPALIKKAIEALAPSEGGGGNGGGPAEWGQITGTLSDQEDLQEALDGKADAEHEHTLADITDAGDLASKDKVEGEDIAVGAVTKEKLSSGVFASTFAIRSGTESSEAVSPAGLRYFAGLYWPIDARQAAADFTTITNTHAGMVIKTDRNMTLAADFAGGQFFHIWNVGVLPVTLSVEAGDQSTGQLNGEPSIDITPGGLVVVVVEANPNDTPQGAAFGDLMDVDLPADTTLDGEEIVTTEGSQLVSDEAGNLLTANAKLWVGEADDEPNDPANTIVCILEEED